MNPFLRAPQWSRPASIEISEVPLEGVPLDSWLPGFPDFPGRARLRAAAYQAFAISDLPVAPLLAWSPSFADFARARLRTVWYQPVAHTNALPHYAVPDLSWKPFFDDFARARARVAQFPFGGYTPTRDLPEANLAWKPFFDDFARARARVVQFPFGGYTNALPNYAVPDLSWKPFFDDFARARARVAQFPFGGYTNALPNYAVPDLSWKPFFDDFARARARVVQFPFGGYTPTRDLPEANLAWKPFFDDFARARQRDAWYQPDLATDWIIPVPLLAWAPSFPEFPGRASPRVIEFSFIAFPIPIVPPPFNGTRVIVIHTPDEIPVGSETKFSVEYDVGGSPLPFDFPPTLRIYHLDKVTGSQITDLAAAPMTQYGINPAYFRVWTPNAKGVYILEVMGVYITTDVLAVLPVTVRPKFDPIGLAIDDVLVARNGDVET